MGLGKTNKGGKQAAEKGNPRRTVIQVTVGNGDAPAIRRLAAKAGESVSTWCYDAIKAKLRREMRKEQSEDE